MSESQEDAAEVELVAGAIGYALAILGHDLKDEPLESAARAAIKAMRESQ